MRCLALLVLAPLALAQSPLVTLTGGTNLGNVGNNLYFDLQVNTTVTITQISFLVGGVFAGPPVATSGSCDIWLGPTTYVGNTTNQGLWTQVATTGPVPIAPAVMSTGTLTVPLCLGPGNYGVALKSNQFAHGYTNGVTCTSTTIPGSCSNSVFSNAELTLKGGANQNTSWTSGLNQPRIFNGSISYTLGGTPVAIASWQGYGLGCYKFHHTFQENYLNPSTSFDLGNATGTNSLHLSFIGTGYIVGPFNTTGTYFTPTGAATPIISSDATNATVTLPFGLVYPMPSGAQVTTQLEVSDNGWISPQPGTNATAGANPTEATWLVGGPRWGMWYNFNPALNASSIKTELDPSGQIYYVTWDGVADSAAATDINHFQMAFFANGDVEYRWGSMVTGTGGTAPALVGWTPGGGVLDPGDVDISAITAPFTTGPTDNPPLTLSLTQRPQLGTSPGFLTSNIPAGTALAALILSFGQVNPGIDLGFLGAPGCSEYVNLGGAVTTVFVVSGSSTTFNFAIPNLPVYNGQLLYGQSASFTSGYNPLGILASNGVRLVVGTL
jgi:hypothetical protein